MKLQRRITVELDRGSVEVSVPSALQVMQFEEAFRTCESAMGRFNLSVELLTGNLEDVEDYPISVVTEIALKVVNYVFLGEVEKKPQDTP